MAETSYSLWLKAQQAGDKRSYIQYNDDLINFFKGYQNALNSTTNAQTRRRAANQYLANIRKMGQ